MASAEVSQVIKINPEDGATFGDIVSFIMKHTNYDEGRTKRSVMEVIMTGIAMKRIVRTLKKKYVLIDTRPSYINYRIKESNFSDDSGDDDSGYDNEESRDKICTFIYQQISKQPCKIFY